MSLFDTLRGWVGLEGRSSSPENPRVSLGDPAILDLVSGGVGAGSSVAPVSPQRAVQTAAVYACVRVLAQSVAALPLETYRRTRKGTELAIDSDVYGLLHDAPNPYQTAYTFREQGMSQAALWGNFYAEIQRDVMTGRPIALYPLPAWSVTPRLERRGEEMVKVYQVGDAVLEDENVLHVPALGWDGIQGLSPIAVNRASVTLSLHAEEFGANFMKAGTRLSGVLEHPKTLTPVAAENLKRSWPSTYGGSANAGKVAVLEEGMKFSAMSMPMNDAQYIETRKFQVSDIARLFGVPPHKIADLDRSTNNNIEHQGKEFLSDTLRPWLARWEQEINRKLFTPIQRKRYFSRFDTADLLRGDMKSRYDAYAVARQWGWLSANDVRELEDMNKVDGGDVYLTPLNMVDSTKLEEITAAKNKPADAGASTTPTPDAGKE